MTYYILYDSGVYICKGEERSVAEHYGIQRRKTKLGKSVKYSLSSKTEDIGPVGDFLRLESIDKILYNKNSPLSITNRARSRNKSSIGWVYRAEIFSVVENKLFHEKISEINQGSQAFQKTLLMNI